MIVFHVLAVKQKSKVMAAGGPVRLSRLKRLPEDFFLVGIIGFAEKPIPAKDAMVFSKSDTIFEKTEDITVIMSQRPIDPGGFVVLTPAVVVAILGAPEFIARGNHRHSLGEQQGQSHALHTANAQLLYLF